MYSILLKFQQYCSSPAPSTLRVLLTHNQAARKYNMILGLGLPAAVLEVGNVKRMFCTILCSLTICQ